MRPFLPSFLPFSVTLLALGSAGCTDLIEALEALDESTGGGVFSASDTAHYQSEVEEGIGAAIAILVDTSGSMDVTAPRSSRPKHVVARQALRRTLDATDRFVRRRPDFPIKVAVYGFSSQPWQVMPVQTYDRRDAQRAVEQLPLPGGGTAIGEAMLAARPELYRSGVYRKYMLVITDGENTSGRDPASVAHEIHEKSEGSVQLYFVAFDVDPALFGFLEAIGGGVVPAGDAKELRGALKDIYEGKILAEAVDYGEKPIPPEPASAVNTSKKRGTP